MDVGNETYVVVSFTINRSRSHVSYLGEDDKILTVDSELPMVPRRDNSELLTRQEDDVDIDKLPRASANKKRKGKIPLEETSIIRKD